MCRGLAEGNRRCPCDTSEARRLRRHNAKAIATYSIELNPSVLGETDLPVTVITGTQSDADTSIESIKAKIGDVDAIQAMADNRNGIDLPDQTVVLSDGNSLVYASGSYSYVDADGEKIPLPYWQSGVYLLDHLAEQYTLKVGEEINSLASQRTGINDEDINTHEKQTIKDLEAKQEELKKKYEAIEEEARTVYPPVYDKFERDVALIEAVRNGDDKAKEFMDRIRNAKNEYYDVGSKLNTVAESGSPEAVALLEKQRAELMNVLKEIRPLGGTEVKVAEKSNKEAANLLQEITEVYPTSWVEDTNNLQAVRVKKTARRAHYNGGAFQNSYKVIDKRRTVVKPADWEPDELDRSYQGDWLKVEGDKWLNPDTGVTIGHHKKPDEVMWVYTPVEYYRPWSGSNYDPESKPPGRGWVKTKINERVYDKENRRMTDETVVVTAWYRPLRERKMIERVREPELTISGGSRSTAIHEFAHRVEHSHKVGGRITKLERTFLARRTTDAETGEREKLKRIYPGTKEAGYADNFADVYMGKIYNDGNYHELLSTGAEAVFEGRFGGLVGMGRRQADPEMKNFIVGLWGSV